MAYLKKLKITGFKSILDQEIELGRFNIFIGTNGAGKSNLLEAIAFLSSSIEGGVDYERLARRGARLSSPEIFRTALKNKRRRKSFSIEAETSNYVYKMSIDASNSFSYNSESLREVDAAINLCGRSNVGATIYGDSLKSKVDREKSIIQIFRAFEEDNEDLAMLEDFAIYAPASPILRGVATDNSNKSPVGLYGGRLAEALFELLRDSSERKSNLRSFFKLLDWFKSVGITTDKDKKLISEYVSLGREVVVYTDQFMKINFNKLYAYDVSEGALYILFVLVLMSHPESPKFFALDNIDSALNPGLVRNLTSHIAEIIENEQEKQVIMTTHNPSAIDSIDLFNDSHRLFVVSRSDDGQTIVERIKAPAGYTKERWAEENYGLKLSELWLSGSIGGMTSGF